MNETNIGVRVGATPEPTPMQISAMQNVIYRTSDGDFDATEMEARAILEHAWGWLADTEMAGATPEPLTAGDMEALRLLADELRCDDRPTAAAIVDRARAALEGGVSPQPLVNDSWATDWLTIGAEIHPLTANLVVRFARALAAKLAAAEKKYGYTDGWRRDDWMDECRAHLREHVEKGDPRDVAAYCAFLWHHGAPTNVGEGGVSRTEPALTENEINESWNRWVKTTRSDHLNPYLAFKAGCALVATKGQSS